MGIQPLFCCFSNMSPIISAITGIGASVLSFAFMIWGIADLWFKKSGVEVIYIISFVLVILCLVLFILLLVFIFITDSRGFNNFARVLCLVILIMCAVAFIFMLISWIILIVDYAKLRKDKKDDEEECLELLDITGTFSDNPVKNCKIPSSEWAAVFVPSLITLIALPIMALAANYLYKVFTDKMNTTQYPVNIPNNSMPTIPNTAPPEIIPNINGPVPPMGNNVPFPVPIQQSVVNINQ